MSFAPAGGGANIESILTQIIRAYLEGLETTSSGGDSPKTNTVIPTSLPEVSGFGEVIDSAIRETVIRHMEENGMLGGQGLGPTGVGGGTEQQGGLTEGQITNLGSQAMGFLQNPETLVSAGIVKLPHAVLITFALSMLPIILHELTKPGGPFDLRFKRIIQNEFNALMDRQSQYDFAIGEKGLIVQSRAGFLNRNTGGVDTNTLRVLRKGGIDKNMMTSLDYMDNARGFW